MHQPESEFTADSFLLGEIALGSREAFNALFEKYWEKAYAEAYKSTKEKEAAKDIVQEIFTHIWISREILHIENLPAYLHIAIRNKVLHYIARQKRIHPFFDFLYNLPEKHALADSNLLWKEFFRSYEALLNTLPPKRQMIFRLRYQENLPTKDISFLLGVSRKTVQNQLGKAIETLRVSLFRVFFLVLLWFFTS
jgi:RNA polymerase sigma-70 factor (ECF subfamily)